MFLRNLILTFCTTEQYSRRQLIFYFEYLNHQNTIKFLSPKRKCFILNISTTKIYSNLLTLKCIFCIIPQPPNTVY